MTTRSTASTLSRAPPSSSAPRRPRPSRCCRLCSPSCAPPSPSGERASTSTDRPRWSTPSRAARSTSLPREGGGLVLAKLEGGNPAGSVKDRPAFAMIADAERAGVLRPGIALVEATSGNTGIALAAAAAVKGYAITLVLPEGSSRERTLSMRAYGATVIETDRERGMERARRRRGDRRIDGRGATRSVRQPGQPCCARRIHRPRDLGADRRNRHPRGERDGHHGNHHGRVALAQGALRWRAHRGRAARARKPDPRHPRLVAAVPAGDLRPERGGRDPHRDARACRRGDARWPARRVCCWA